MTIQMNENTHHNQTAVFYWIVQHSLSVYLDFYHSNMMLFRVLRKIFLNNHRIYHIIFDLNNRDTSYYCMIRWLMTIRMNEGTHHNQTIVFQQKREHSPLVYLSSYRSNKITFYVMQKNVQKQVLYAQTYIYIICVLKQYIIYNKQI